MRFILPITLILLISLVCCGFPTAGLATNWHLVAAIDDHQQEQFVDPDSIRAVATGRVQVSSYYIDRRSGQAATTFYLTEYDCLHRQFRDVEYEGPVGQSSWQSVESDPLNAAAMDYACTKAG